MHHFNDISELEAAFPDHTEDGLTIINNRKLFLKINDKTIDLPAPIHTLLHFNNSLIVLTYNSIDKNCFCLDINGKVLWNISGHGTSWSNVSIEEGKFLRGVSCDNFKYQIDPKNGSLHFFEILHWK